MSKQTTKQEIIQNTSLDFDNIPASTKTFIVKTNIIIDIEKLFHALPITPYIVVQKRRGRKKKNTPANPNKDLIDGSIITLELENKLRGVDLKNKKNKQSKSKSKRKGHITYFRNSTSVVMIIDGKIINFKISRNGNFQMTGCKYIKQAEKCTQYIWETIKDTDMYHFVNEEDKHLEVLFVPAMRNQTINLGFQIDRERLDEFINTQTPYFSLLETSIGYTGVNIKFPFEQSILDINVKQRKLIDGVWRPIVYVPYSKYLDMHNEKDRKKKLEKKRYTTFLVFHSGKSIMSCINREFGRKPFIDFMTIIKENRHIFEEKLDDIIEPDEKN